VASAASAWPLAPGRSPYSRGLYAIQETKQKLNRFHGNPYIGSAIALLRSMVVDYEALLDDAACEDPGVWLRLFTLACNPDLDEELRWRRSTIRDLIRKTVLSNLTELLRRFEAWGIGRRNPSPQYAVFVLLTAEDAQSRIEIIDNLLAESPRHQCIDGVSLKLVTFFKSDLNIARANDGNLPNGTPGN
jgi:hypothetical protein